MVPMTKVTRPYDGTFLQLNYTMRSIVCQQTITHAICQNG